MEIRKNQTGLIAVQVIYVLSAISLILGLYLYFKNDKYEPTAIQGVISIGGAISGLITGVVISLLVDIEYNQRVQIHLMPEPPKDNGKS